MLPKMLITESDGLCIMRVTGAILRPESRREPCEDHFFTKVR